MIDRAIPSSRPFRRRDRAGARAEPLLVQRAGEPMSLDGPPRAREFVQSAAWLDVAKPIHYRCATGSSVTGDGQ